MHTKKGPDYFTSKADLVISKPPMPSIIERAITHFISLQRFGGQTAYIELRHPVLDSELLHAHLSHQTSWPC